MPQSTEWTRLAALREADAARWQARFEQLFAANVLSLPVAPGAEHAVRMQKRLARQSAAEVDSFFYQSLLPLVRAGIAVGADLSSVSVNVACALAQRLNDAQLGADRALISLTDAQFVTAAPTVTRLMPRVAVRFSVPANERAAAGWAEFVAMSYSNPNVVPVPSRSVRPLSGLHAAERGQVVLPHSLFEVPLNTAWLWLEVDARQLGSPQETKRQLARCLRFADNLIDVIPWPSNAQKLDALLNRRVAINLSHIGDHFARQGGKPADANALQRLRNWLMFVRQCVVHASNTLARRRGPFPELCTADLMSTLTPRYTIAEAQQLVRNRILRHRHLLALSPLAVIPTDAEERSGMQFDAQQADAWLNLIPALSCADIVTMRGPDPRSRLDLQGWSRLLALTAAVTSNYTIHSGSRRY